MKAVAIKSAKVKPVDQKQLKAQEKKIRASCPDRCKQNICRENRCKFNSKRSKEKQRGGCQTGAEKYKISRKQCFSPQRLHANPCQKQNASKDSKNKQIIVIWISVTITTKEVKKEYSTAMC